MSFRKATFQIRMNKEHGYEVKEVTGWIDESNVIGYHKSEGKGTWIGSDLVTGGSVFAAKTRKEVYAFVDQNRPIIDKARKIMVESLKKDGVGILIEKS